MLNKNKTPDRIEREVLAKVCTYLPKTAKLLAYTIKRDETRYGRIVFTYKYNGQTFRADIPRHSDYTFGAKKGE